MNVEMVLKKVPIFSDLVLDTVLFESKYPVLFTCKNENDVYLFSCCLLNTVKAQWIGTKTNYEILIKLLQNRITIREAFLDGCEEKIIVEYDGKDVQYKIVNKTLVALELLPTAGEYMDAEEDEYVEEIAVFESRSRNLEFRIKPRISNFYIFTYRRENVVLADEFFNVDSKLKNDRIFDFRKISNCNIAYA